MQLENVNEKEFAASRSTMQLHNPVFHLKMEDGSVFDYYPHTSVMLDQDSKPVSLQRFNLDYFTKSHPDIHPVSPESPGQKKAIRLLKITMGFKCNFTCSYCSQAAHRYVDRQRKPGDIDRFIERIESLLPLNEKGRGARIEFWGGEPLVYWQILKPLAEGLRVRYPEADFMTITNGSLLTDEHVEWFHRMNFAVGISHDGPGFKFRGKDPLDDPEQRQRIKNLVSLLAPKGRMSFNCVLSVPNPSLRAIYDHLENVLGMTGFPLSSEGVTSQYEPVIAPLVPKNFDEMRALWRQIFVDSCNEKMIRYSSTVKTALTDFFESLASARPAQAVGQKCGMDRPSSLAVDLDGTATTCQNVSANAGHKIGQIDSLDEVRLTTAKHWSHHQNCRNCVVVQMCKGSCMYMDGPERKPVCDGHFTFYFGLFATALFILTGKKLVSVHSERVRLEGHDSLEF